MGSYDGAKIYELVSVYILSHLETIVNNNEMGLYRDDGFLSLWGATDKKNG